MLPLVMASVLASAAGCEDMKSGVHIPPITQAPPQAQLDQPVQHVFVIFKENHTYDNYFAGYPNPGGDPPTTSGLGANGRVIPLREPGKATWSPGPNSFDVAHGDYDGGRMDGFDQARHQPGSESGSSEGLLFDPDGVDASYVSYGLTPDIGRARLTYYWFLADQGVLCDRFFTCEMGPSFPNHLYLLAASSGGVISNPEGGHFDVLLASGGKSRRTHISSREVATALPVELERAGLTWTVLQETSYTPIFGPVKDAFLDLSGSVRDIDVVKALPDFEDRVKETPFLDSRMAEYLAKGWDAQVTLVKPNDVNSEHPGAASVGVGQDWTRSIIDAIGTSPDWPHCVIFLTWDDYGGFYDHVPPPQVDDLGLGFRVPCLIVSPFVKKGVVQHEVRSVASILRFCEKTFGLPTMTVRDFAAEDLMSAFDFERPPRPYSDFVPPPGP